MATPLDTIRTWFGTLDGPQQHQVAFQTVMFWAAPVSEPDNPNPDWVKEFELLLTPNATNAFAVAGRAIAISALLDFVLAKEATKEGLEEGRRVNENMLEAAKKQRAEPLVKLATEKLANWDTVAAAWMRVGDAWRAHRASSLSLRQIDTWLRVEAASEMGQGVLPATILN